MVLAYTEASDGCWTSFQDLSRCLVYYVYFQESKHVKALKVEELHPFCFFSADYADYADYADANLTLKRDVSLYGSLNLIGLKANCTELRHIISPYITIYHQHFTSPEIALCTGGEGPKSWEPKSMSTGSWYMINMSFSCVSLCFVCSKCQRVRHCLAA